VVVGALVSFEMNDRKSKRLLAHPLRFPLLSLAVCEAVWCCVRVCEIVEWNRPYEWNRPTGRSIHLSNVRYIWLHWVALAANVHARAGER
jgi:hypothetical protein